MMNENEDIIDRIANGTAILLGIDDICTRLGVSRTTFDRWVRNGSSGILRVRRSGGGLSNKLTMGITAGDIMTNVQDVNMSFPPPDIRIGNSPKWEISTFKNWLRKNITTD